MYIRDTIVAPATAPGAGAVAIIRLSGPRALEILRAIWKPSHDGDLKPRRVYLGHVIDPDNGALLDRALAFLMHAPASLTGEDVAELQVHGGPFLVRRIVSLVVSRGARPAEPGEFTRRGFLNGRTDLTEAEAVDDLVNAHGEAALRQALAQLSGALAQKVRGLRDKIVGIRAHLEAEIDFSDEDIRLPSRHQLAGEIERIIGDVAILHDSFVRGRLARDGARAAIVGKPNVGKSSLLNLLLGTDRAIVTDIPGTTRDVIEDTIQLGPIPLTILDSAGLRGEGGDAVERLGIERTRRSVAEADLLIAVFDSSRALDCDDAAIVALCDQRSGIAVLNKSDLPAHFGTAALHEAGLSMPALAMSALTADGLEGLRRELASTIDALAGRGAESEIAISRGRHRDALAQALSALKAGRESALRAMPPEIVAVDIAGAADALGAITGEVSSEDVLDRIFSEFCIGK
jgi:tRNA modification GTPase